MARKPTKGPAPKDASKAKSRKPSKAAPAQAVSGKPVQVADTNGRPTIYTEALGLSICAHIADGLSLRKIEALPGMPAKITILTWALDDREGFRTIYARARELQLEAEADEIADIADDGRNDFMERANKDGETTLVYNREHVDRSKLRVETRKWRLTKLAPHKYGDKIEQKHTGMEAFAAIWSQMGGGASKSKTGS